MEQTKYYSIIRRKESYFDSETGKIINELGQITGYIDFNCSENSYIYRDVFGTVNELMVSGIKDSIDDIDMRKELYKNWNYYEKTSD